MTRWLIFLLCLAVAIPTWAWLASIIGDWLVEARDPLGEHDDV